MGSIMRLLTTLPLVLAMINANWLPFASVKEKLLDTMTMTLNCVLATTLRAILTTIVTQTAETTLWRHTTLRTAKSCLSKEITLFMWLLLSSQLCSWMDFPAMLSNVSSPPLRIMTDLLTLPMKLRLNSLLTGNSISQTMFPFMTELTILLLEWEDFNLEDLTPSKEPLTLSRLETQFNSKLPLFTSQSMCPPLSTTLTQTSMMEFSILWRLKS